ncbi:MAG: hypothetical protein ACM65L_12775 [Microcoleus sp.]
MLVLIGELLADYCRNDGKKKPRSLEMAAGMPNQHLNKLGVALMDDNIVKNPRISIIKKRLSKTTSRQID